MSSQICLKWNSFLNNIATSFESLWEEEGLVDVTLASDGQCLTAHRVILSASSPFFKKVFQTNPCQHPVIILQDVHFSELEALLIFIYKGEVNIEQKNLPALLKAAETLQIRGLSGGDVFAKESYKRLAELEKSESNDALPPKEETPKKKQRTSKSPNHSILERALTPQIPQNEASNETTLIEQNFKEPESGLDPLCQRLELKAEPFEVSLEELQKHSPISKESLDRLDTGQSDSIQGSSKHAVTVIAEARHTSSPSPEPQTHPKTSAAEKRHNQHPLNLPEAPNSPNSSQPNSSSESPNELLEPLSFPSDRNPNLPRPAFPPFNNPSNSDPVEDSQLCKGCPAYPPFPCPFCDRAYTSWGFRRRHIKAVHTISPSLNCKWCLQVLPTHAAWRRHVISAHNLSASDAHNGLLILEEAHMVLQIAHPTRLDTLVNIIKQSSQQTSGQDNPQPDIDKELS